jgi:hypothetical protein
MLLATLSYSQSFKVVGHSWIAKVAGRMTGQELKYAVTFGKTIYVSCDKNAFLSERGWTRHELTHVGQYKKYGVLEFLKRYVFYSIFHRYENNPFEKEALYAEEAGDSDDPPIFIDQAKRSEAPTESSNAKAISSIDRSLPHGKD